MTIHQRRDDYPNPWRIQVRGHPARRDSISWREAIRDAVTATYPQAPFTSPPWGTKFTVEVIFRMTPEDLARPAFHLDNFAKPVLDTLFTSQNVSRLTGVLLPGVNDTWVFRAARADDLRGCLRRVTCDNRSAPVLEHRGREFL